MKKVFKFPDRLVSTSILERNAKLFTSCGAARRVIVKTFWLRKITQAGIILFSKFSLKCVLSIVAHSVDEGRQKNKVRNFGSLNTIYVQDMDQRK
jgi:hypothetical protein